MNRFYRHSYYSYIVSIFSTWLVHVQYCHMSVLKLAWIYHCRGLVEVTSWPIGIHEGKRSKKRKMIVNDLDLIKPVPLQTATVEAISTLPLLLIIFLGKCCVIVFLQAPYPSVSMQDHCLSADCQIQIADVSYSYLIVES